MIDATTDISAHVCYGSKAAEITNPKYVRYASDNGRNQRKNGHRHWFVRLYEAVAVKAV